MRHLILAAALLASPIAAQEFPGNSAPQPAPFAETIPAARDVAYPGTLRIAVDATDIPRGIFRVTETVPVSGPGRTTLLYPKWIPGAHSPSGQIDKIAGLTVTAGGRPLAWVRDDVDVTAFHVEVPAGVKAIEVTFQYLGPTDKAQGRIVTTPDMLNLQWISTTLYPAGYFVRRIPVEASVTLPEGFKAASALEVASVKGSTIRYRTVPYDVLVDSPLFAGRFTRTETLAPGVRLNIFADRPEQLAASPEQIAAHRRMAEQAIRLFGAQHYDHYDFQFALSDNQGTIGLEHHRSSENGTIPGYFTDWAATPDKRSLLPHEFTHSWNGKFRRARDLWTPDYRTPMRDSLLWVYEGQTQLWGEVLAARSGLRTQEEALGALASVAALYDNRAGRQWRPVADTTNDPIISQRRPKAWLSWQRSEDYYSEGMLVWLEADSLIREASGGTKSLDDFARAFFGVRDRDFGELTYRFDDVVATLNGVVPYDWATFLHERIDRVQARAPLGWIARGGYRLVYADTPTAYWKAVEASGKITDLAYSLGLTIGRDGTVSNVAWDGPAFQAGVTVGSTVLAVDGRTYDAAGLKAAITAAKGGKAPIRLLLKQGDRYREAAVTWAGGLRYPRLERTGAGPAGLDALLAPR